MQQQNLRQYSGNRRGIGGNQQQSGGNQQQPGGYQQHHGGYQQHHGGNQHQLGGNRGNQKEEFEFFFGPKFTFSQMHPAIFTVDGIQFCCMEQYMQYQKAVTFGDNKTAKLIMSTQDPKQHKKLGRKVSPFDPRTWGWKSVAVVKRGNIHKFLQNPSMKKVLFDTYPKTLVEASPRDRLWGIGMGKDNPDARDRSKWRGKNLLGQTLTEVRDHLMDREGLIPHKTNYDKHCNNKKDKDVSKKSDEHKHSEKSDEHKHSKKSDKHKHSKKSDEHKHSEKSDEHKHSKKSDEHKHSKKSDEHKRSKKSDEHKHSEKSDEHKHSKKSDEHKHNKKSDEHKHNKKSDEHRSPDRFDTNESGRKDEQISSGSKFRDETTHQKERSGDGKSSSSKKSKHEDSKDSSRSDGRHQSDEESSSSKKRKHEEDSHSERSHQPDEESSSSKKRKLEDGSHSVGRHGKSSSENNEKFTDNIDEKSASILEDLEVKKGEQYKEKDRVVESEERRSQNAGKSEARATGKFIVTEVRKSEDDIHPDSGKQKQKKITVYLPETIVSDKD